MKTFKSIITTIVRVYSGLTIAIFTLIGISRTLHHYMICYPQHRRMKDIVDDTHDQMLSEAADTYKRVWKWITE